MTIPAQWVDTPPSSGFQYTAGGNGPPQGFVGVSARSGVVPVSVSQLEASRRQFLQGNGAVIDSVKTGTVDHHPAVRLHYKLAVPSRSVVDTEYDIVTTTSLPVGAAQRQTVYNVIVIVVGTPVSHPDQSLVDWIGSTIRVNS